jgi:lipid A ethanolaminephosphotransferase
MKITMRSSAHRLLFGGLLLRKHWHVSMPVFICLAAVFNTVAYHFPLYAFAIRHLDMTALRPLVTFATLVMLVMMITVLLIGLVAVFSKRLVKPVCMTIAMCNAGALYFMVTYGVVLDKTMMGNVFNTNSGEAGDLFHPWVLAYVIGLGIVPCWFCLKVQIDHTGWWRRLMMPIGVIVFVVCWLYAASSSWLWIDRYAKQIGGMVLPWSYVINSARYLAEQAAPHDRQLLPAITMMSQDKKVVFLVIGESARAHNFSVYGYGRMTNPEMNQAGVTIFKKTQACATYTTASLECILAHQPPGSRAQWEPLTSYLQRHGVEVIWRTNNAGEPPMQVHQFVHLAQLRDDCHDDACEFDEGLLHGLEQYIETSEQQHILVVLHLAGSHGPAYYTRYPSRFEVFKPVCQSVQLHQCTNDELINAYDNTILYTDFVIGQAIALLKRVKTHTASLLYVSDHGESLGEYNLYLHGTPLAIAPDVQKDIPLIVWSGNGHRDDSKTLPIVVDGAFSQANVFHSVMGALDVQSDVFDPALNLFTTGGGR